MRVFLFRHAERENSGQADPSLSQRGLRQADHLRDLVTKGEWEKPDRLWVSPRLRTLQTFAPTAAALSLTPQVISELDERRSSESGPQFTQRVRRLILDIAQVPGATYLCTHLDWIEEAMIAIPTTEDLLSQQHQIWEPGRHMVFEVLDGVWSLIRTGGISA